MWESISQSSNEVEERGFWEAIRVWMERPHIVNRRLMGIDITYNWMVTAHNTTVTEPSDTVWRILSDNDCNIIDINAIFHNEFKLIGCEQSDIWEENGNNSGLFIQIRRLLPKQPKKFEIQVETVIIDRNEKKVIFLSPRCKENNCFLTPNFDYRLMLTGSLRIKLEKASDNQSLPHQQSLQWLESHVFHKICNWSKQQNNPKSIPSLSIIPVPKYYTIYQRLKETYWQKLVEMWPECTDPVKYIYEDIAIASYLLTIFELENESKNLDRKQSFVDLGCGNGLLVYLLTSEGHRGIGIDVRKRTIWSLYGPEVQLIETAVTPSDKMLFPDFDWLIGNHSDELTPWIPVIAARSSYDMRVFLLPCCSFSFEGKYQRVHSGCSQYQSYLSFIKEVCEKMGFNVQQDKLRIPSTKRLCFVCLSRNYVPSEEHKIDYNRTEYIKQFVKRTASNKIERTSENDFHDHSMDSNRNLHSVELEAWTCGFQPRSKLQEVVNCSHLDSVYLENIVTKLATILLNLEKNFIELFIRDQQLHWNKGGEISIRELASLLEPELLQQLKHQCGGLQTLLRNHRHIFSVKNGKVSITVPVKETDQVKNVAEKQKKKRKVPKYKTRPCWFFFHHPQGCPLGYECGYLHEEKIN